MKQSITKSLSLNLLLMSVFSILLLNKAYCQVVPEIKVTWHLENKVLKPWNTIGDGYLIKIATIYTDEVYNSNINFLQQLYLNVTTSGPIISGISTSKLWIHNPYIAGPFNAGLSPTVINGNIFDPTIVRTIAPFRVSSSQQGSTYEIWMQFNMNTEVSNCQWIKFRINTVWNNAQLNDTYDGKSEFYFARYANNLTEYNTPDLFVKDNSFDTGVEPNWQSSISDITKSVSILNKLNGVAVRDYNGLNPQLMLNNYAQPSTLGNYNTMNVLVENRGCAATTANANLNLYWTVARIWEPWGHDWHNFSNYPTFAGSNFVNWLNPSTNMVEQKPMGNNITLMDKNNYKSDSKPIEIPSGILHTSRNLSTFENTGGFLASVQWNPPVADWYRSSSTIFHHNNVEPVICYLAEIKEPYKQDSGFYQSYSLNSSVSITDYALYNNNVATVNSYLASPNGLYKSHPTAGKFRSNIGVIYVTNPSNPISSIPISIVLEGGQPIFRNHGSIYVIFDEILWHKWNENGMSGSGFEIVTEQVVKITNDSLVTFTGIELGEQDRGMLGVQFEYDGDNVPENDFLYSLSVGTFNENPMSQIGSPTHFITHVLHTPVVDGESGFYKNGSTNFSNNIKIDFVNMYPNPVTEKLNLMFELKHDAGNISIEVYDLQLRLIKKHELNQVRKGGFSYAISTDDLSGGNYLLKLKVEDSIQTFKFIK